MKPIPNRQYRLTGPDSIAEGKSWAESAVEPTFAERVASVRARAQRGESHTEAFVECIVSGVERCTDCARPTAEEIRATVPAVCNKRAWKSGRVQFLARAPKDADNATGALHSALAWHRSGGNLHGLFGARYRYGAELCDAWDTVAQVWLVVVGRRSSAIDAWKRTGIV